MRRVLLVSWEYPPVVAGGLARHVRGLAESLAAGGDEVHVLTRGEGSELAAGVLVHRVPAGPMPADLDAFLDWVAAMNRALAAAGRALAAAARPDLVHGHDWLVAAAAEELARTLGVPYVTTVHATEHGRHAGRVGAHPQAAVHAAETRMLREAGHVIVCSAFMRDHLAAVFDVPDGRIAVIPNGADAPGKDAGTAPRGRTVLLAGRLVYEKGFDIALDALARLADRGVRCVVAGDGPARGDLEAQARRLGLADHVSFLGWAGDRRLGGLYGSAGVCVVPSRYEPFGLVALEAMAAGCPCVVAATGGLPEVAPQGVALHLTGGGAAELAALIERALGDDALRARLAAAGREHARRFAWADVARRTAGVYGAALRS